VRKNKSWVPKEQFKKKRAIWALNVEKDGRMGRGMSDFGMLV